MSDIDRETGEVLERPQLPAMPEIPGSSSGRPQNLIFASAAPGEVFGALALMQGAMEAPKRTKKAKVKGQTRGGSSYEYEYAYAPLEEIISAIKAPMAKAALAYRQFLAARDGAWVMRTVIAHKSGEWMGCDYPIFWDQARGMQGFASGVTYARRYGLMLALGIAAEDDDDANVADGQIAAVRPARTPAHRPRAAEPTAEDGELKKRYAELVNAIDESLTVPEVEGVAGMPAWAELEKRLKAAKGDAVTQTMMNNLQTRIEGRKNLLLGEPEYEV